MGRMSGPSLLRPNNQGRGTRFRSNAGAQYTAISYAERVADAVAIASIGTVGDSYDNALTETVVGLYKHECVKIDGPFRGATTSNSPPCPGCTGSTRTGCTPQSDTSPPSRPRTRTTERTPPTAPAAGKTRPPLNPRRFMSFASV